MVTIDDVKSKIIEELKDFNWNIIGIIDKDKRIYPLTTDTKFLSKLFEIMLIPIFKNKIIPKLSEKGNECKIVLAKEQNQYPDITLWGGVLGDTKIAIDIKSAYRTSDSTFSGFTLGAFNGYFKNRSSTKNIVFPYKEYKHHWILCFIYQRESVETENLIWDINELDKVPELITNVEIILQDKWKIATTRPGSGNTANIGSINIIEDLKNGNGPFSKLGEDTFNDYWMHYIRKEDASKVGLKNQPFKNIEEYNKWVKEGKTGRDNILSYYKMRDNDTDLESDE